MKTPKHRQVVGDCETLEHSLSQQASVRTAADARKEKTAVEKERNGRFAEFARRETKEQLRRFDYGCLVIDRLHIQDIFQIILKLFEYSILLVVIQCEQRGRPGFRRMRRERVQRKVVSIFVFIIDIFGLLHLK